MTTAISAVSERLREKGATLAEQIAELESARLKVEATTEEVGVLTQELNRLLDEAGFPPLEAEDGTRKDN